MVLLSNIQIKLDVAIKNAPFFRWQHANRHANLYTQTNYTLLNPTITVVDLKEGMNHRRHANVLI